MITKRTIQDCRQWVTHDTLVEYLPITKKERDGDKITGKVIGTYPHFFMVQHGDDRTTRTSFTYTDLLSENPLVTVLES